MKFKFQGKNRFNRNLPGQMVDLIVVEVQVQIEGILDLFIQDFNGFLAIYYFQGLLEIFKFNFKWIQIFHLLNIFRTSFLLIFILNFQVLLINLFSHQFIKIIFKNLYLIEFLSFYFKEILKFNCKFLFFFIKVK